MKLLPVIGAVGLASSLALPASVALTTTPAAPAAWAVVAGLAMYSLAKRLK